MGWFRDRLAGLDRRNQAVADFLRDIPDAGTKVNPYAKNDRARRWIVMSLLLSAALGAVLGWKAGIAAVVVASVVLWRHEHHPWLDAGRRSTTGHEGDNDDPMP